VRPRDGVPLSPVFKGDWWSWRTLWDSGFRGHHTGFRGHHTDRIPDSDSGDTIPDSGDTIPNSSPDSGFRIPGTPYRIRGHHTEFKPGGRRVRIGIHAAFLLLEGELGRLRGFPAKVRLRTARVEVSDRSAWDWYAESCSCGLLRGECRTHPRARASQRPPAGDWRVWTYVAGRGAGKTRAGHAGSIAASRPAP